jgi:hypothetical protein
MKPGDGLWMLHAATAGLAAGWMLFALHGRSWALAGLAFLLSVSNLIQMVLARRRRTG